MITDLERTQNSQNDLVYYLPEALIELDQSEHIIYMNRMALLLFGYTEDDVLKKMNASQLFPSKEYKRIADIINTNIANNTNSERGYQRSKIVELYEGQMKKKDKRIIIDTIIDNEYITVNVKDFGTTLGEFESEKIFGRKYQIKRGRGKGLGLSIAKRIAEAHNGRIGVKPNKPTGNIFFVKFHR